MDFRANSKHKPKLIIGRIIAITAQISICGRGKKTLSLDDKPNISLPTNHDLAKKTKPLRANQNQPITERHMLHI